ncbi:Transcriptional regulator, TetR family OS=Tsukamurella paurometabola (strain ATCC 8368 / DSM/ CCUG 35730 / CIP 100753 / JCM 10117 / KCTC 9821 / NBRC 16120/ NCIMB 702349 / NCTC 13040) OX=521096 GN=Tpau_2395 PE=4 SV=1 [Tsukamurella paurometabola]|uniref:Transcriptional regulator, TetR family n=1 Tax=Tsukamurella paurometabola (strain ATCC 8368 / DSM 20162 / CCUG 35730 / CIP 100753 / JCM 10117 / KCTC 9821 / NBRC 16120 / NCIMB 702349 / NCTC 13040) TaxID=521096 RepID=D5UR12_TSUPD|nr:TetR family transcriptional regulator [Tsukamurella paurometabola]ADG79001.1 transcriptional regulator, TetR family [Tsukamurella paurometabola DSM 20162]SUP33741.1 HTH-type transcriptional repressor KstR2 [Tsukamurella paurometabola]
MSGPARRSGRRTGSPDTRAEILTAARTAFARGGLAGTTVRSIAEAAGVDSALVHHYFGTKQDLYLAALAIPVDPEFVRAPLREAPLDDAARALLRALLTMWDGPLRDVGVAVIRTNLGNSGDPAIVRGFLLEIALAELIGRMEAGPGDGVLRANLMVAQVFGLLVARYIVGFEPLASLTVDEVVDLAAPPLQQVITGPLHHPDRD